MPDVMRVADAPPEPVVRMRFVHARLTLAADLCKTLRRKILAANEIAIGGADRAGRETVEPRIIHQQRRELDLVVSEASAGRRFQQAPIVLRVRAAVQRPHDLEYLDGVVLVREQPAQCFERRTPLARNHSKRRVRHRVVHRFVEGHGSHSSDVKGSFG
jgi:hypothetical protein